MFRRDRKSSPERSGRRVFAGNPYLFLGPRPFREARLRAYIAREHSAGRSLDEIRHDPYVHACGSDSFCWKVIVDPRTIKALSRT